MMLENLFTHHYELACPFDIALQRLTEYHYFSCPEYAVIVDHIFPGRRESIEDIPFLPANIFKNIDLYSVSQNEIVKVMHSSGTSGRPSRINMSKDNLLIQKMILYKLFTERTNLNRPNMVIFDEPNILDTTSAFTARKAGIIGFSQFCKSKFSAFTSNLSLDVSLWQRLLTTDRPILAFGFTSVAWNMLRACDPLPSDMRDHISRRCIFLHGGGWKKLQSQNITQHDFREMLFDKLGIIDIINYYGMIEQTGSIYFECSSGRLHQNRFSKLIVRDAHLQPVRSGISGYAQVFSPLPISYPGHSILTDDLVTIHSDICSCGSSEPSFIVHGRAFGSVQRGCSDAIN